MAVYKVTDLKTQQTTTTSDLRYLYAKLHDVKVVDVENTPYESFRTTLTESPDFQTALNVEVEEINARTAITQVRTEMAEATRRQKEAKAQLQELTATALADVTNDTVDGKSVKDQVSGILTDAQQAAVHVQGWFEVKTKNGKTTGATVTHVTLPKHVNDALMEIAEERAAERAGDET